MMKNRAAAPAAISISQSFTEAVAERQVVDINRVVSFLVLALVVYFIITEPKSAASVVQSLAYTLKEAADSITVFFRAVV